MPSYSKPAAGRDNKKPYSKGAAPKGAAPKGAQREGHRGYRADQASAAPKKRWTQDDRAARTGDRPTGSARPAADRRPDWTPREKPAANRGERPAYGDRTARPAYGDRTERPSYGNRPARPSYGDRTERPSYSDRTDRPERPAYGAYDRSTRRAPSAHRPSDPAENGRATRRHHGSREAS